MAQTLSHKSVFGTASLTFGKRGNTSKSDASYVAKKFPTLDEICGQHIRLDMDAADELDVKFEFLPSENTIFSRDTGEALDAFLLERESHQAHIGVRISDQWDIDERFQPPTLESYSETGFKLNLTIFKKCTLNFGLAFASELNPKTDSVASWLAVDFLLPKWI